jgi:hypothetical protein
VNKENELAAAQLTGNVDENRITLRRIFERGARASRHTSIYGTILIVTFRGYRRV